MRLDGFGLLVENMGEMIRFYRDVLGFEIKEEEDSSNVQEKADRQNASRPYRSRDKGAR